MKRTDMHHYLNSLSITDRLPVYIISYKRAGIAPNLGFINDNWERADDVNVVVLQSEKDAYVAAYPRLTVHGLPDDQVNTVGKARWRAAELAHALGDPVIIMMDDDVLKLDFLHHSAHKTGKNAGAECSGLSNKEDRAVVGPSLEERVVMGFGDTAKRVFEQEQLTVLGGMHKRHMSFSPRNHRTEYIINGGATPRQVYVWNVERMMEHNVALNIDLFSRHGDDIGLVAEILKAGLDCFVVPSFVFDHWPEDVNITKSVLRNAQTAPALHAEEWVALQQYPIKDYLRVKQDLIGNYQWGDVDWVKLAKLRQQPTRHIAWDPEMPPAGPFGQPDMASLI